MNSGGEAADQIVSMSLKGIEIIAKISGEGAKNLATYLYAVLKDQKRTKGKVRLESLLRSDKELKVFTVRNTDLDKFCQEAKRYGILYCALRDKKSIDGICDIMVRAEDASKINRIVERFKLATVDTATIKNEIIKDKAAKESRKTAKLKDTSAEKSTNAFIDGLIEKTEHTVSVVPPTDNTNPTMATMEKSHPSEPTLNYEGKTAAGIIEQPKKSVRERLQEIKAARKEQAKPEK